MPGDNVAPASDQNEASGLLQELRNSQQAQVDLLSQITSPESAKSVAPKWADVLAEGLDRTKRLRLAGGPPKPGSRPTGGGLAAAARAAAAEKPDTEEVAQIDAGLQRAGAIEGVAPILEAALAERASREPQGALAEALIKRGVSIPGAGQ